VAIIPERQQYATEFKIDGHIPFPVLRIWTTAMPCRSTWHFGWARR
jgi:hypothetical protein